MGFFIDILYVFFIVDYESCGMIHMDPHSLRPYFMEDGIEVECLSFQKPGSHNIASTTCGVSQG